MGLNKSKRPILAPKGLQIGPGGSTFTGPVVLSGSSSYLTLSNSTVSVTAAAQTLGNRSVDFLTVTSSGSGRDFILPAPQKKGQTKLIFVDNQTTSVDTTIFTNATANTFWGTTYNQVTHSAASTGSPGGTPAGTASLILVAASTTQWAATVGSTFNWDFAASTGSTATA